MGGVIIDDMNELARDMRALEDMPPGDLGAPDALMDMGGAEDMSLLKDMSFDMALDMTVDMASDMVLDMALDMMVEEDMEPDMMVEMPDLGVPVGNCVPQVLPGYRGRVCVDFPSGARSYEVPLFEHSFGTRAVPAAEVLGDQGYMPRPGECSAETHDRYWVRAHNGKVYRTWHPPEDQDVLTGQPCTYGHEHGDDPRQSPLYWWAGGVPFGLVNDAAVAAGMHRHEDHFGHKVVVQNKYEVSIGNPPGDKPIEAAGFHCFWLSKVHQGTHSGDALRHNMHEYQNSVMCDDGNVRRPDVGRELNAGPAHHTENSVKTLAFWGQPGWFKSCEGLVRQDVADPLTSGVEPPMMSDTNREIKCAGENEGWTFKGLPVPITSRTGHVDFAPRDGGIEELWKPWMIVTSRAGQVLFNSSAYYGVLNPARLYNDESYVPRRDVDGDGVVDLWIPTLEFCEALAAGGRNYGQCSNLPAFPANVAATERWKHPASPFNGTIRFIHPKRIDLTNSSSRATFCTDHLGQETQSDPTFDAQGVLRCPPGQLFQRIAATQNLWGYGSSWGADMKRGDLSGSMINSVSPTLGSGIRHEWVRFFTSPGIHTPN